MVEAQDWSGIDLLVDHLIDAIKRNRHAGD